MEYVETINDFHEIPSQEHIEELTQGIIDSLDGNESLSLTPAQHYLEGVLYANGVLPKVDGNEGFLSTIGEGIKKGIEYVKNLFNRIWNFFFGKSAEQKLKEAIDQLDKDMENINKSHAKWQQDTSEQFEKAMVKAAEAAAKDSPENDRAEKIVKEAKAFRYTPKAEKPKEAERIVKEIMTLNFDNLKRINKNYDKLSGPIKNVEKIIDNLKSIPGKESKISSLENSTTTVKNGLIGLEKAVKSIHDLPSAKEAIRKCRSCITAMDNNLEGIRSSKSITEERIKRVEKQLASTDSEADKKEARADLEYLKKYLGACVGIIKSFEHVFGIIRNIVSLINKGVVTIEV